MTVMTSQICLALVSLSISIANHTTCELPSMVSLHFVLVYGVPGVP
jgi:hypothetical protein